MFPFKTHDEKTAPIRARGNSKQPGAIFAKTFLWLNKPEPFGRCIASAARQPAKQGKPAAGGKRGKWNNGHSRRARNASMPVLMYSTRTKPFSSACWHIHMYAADVPTQPKPGRRRRRQVRQAAKASSGERRGKRKSKKKSTTNNMRYNQFQPVSHSRQVPFFVVVARSGEGYTTGRLAPVGRGRPRLGWNAGSVETHEGSSAAWSMYKGSAGPKFPEKTKKPVAVARVPRLQI